jgi:GrpB-like predicted nucleotidyltransferase (UPF0157 family)
MQWRGQGDIAADRSRMAAGGSAALRHSPEVRPMPFPDEITPDGVSVLPYDDQWPTAFKVVRDELGRTLGELALAIDHIGSTSIPGMVAKDCIDVQVRVRSVADPELERRLVAHGFRRRPEPWNTTEDVAGRAWPKQVYAPAPGARPVNIHLRNLDGGNTRHALLFRDYLRSNPDVRDHWSHFKRRLAESVPGIFDYGQIKQPATGVLFAAAEQWALQTGWAPDAIRCAQSCVKTRRSY